MASNSAGHVLTAPFNKSVKVTGHHSEKLTSDAGAAAVALSCLPASQTRLAGPEQCPHSKAHCITSKKAVFSLS